MSRKIKILIMMAGQGLRFKNEGYAQPKPLIPIGNKTMIEEAIEGLKIDGDYIFVIPSFIGESYKSQLIRTLLKYTSIKNIVEAASITEGPVSSALLAKSLINDKDPLIVTNCDLVLDWDSRIFLDYLSDCISDCVVQTYDSQSLGNSYILVDKDGHGIRLAEKEVISNLSLNGLHYFKRGSDFVDAAERLIASGEKIRGEYYVSLAINKMIESGMKVSAFHLSKHETWSTGTPEELNIYLEYKNGKK